jgi:hypothetical protein
MMIRRRSDVCLSLNWGLYLLSFQSVQKQQSHNEYPELCCGITRRTGLSCCMTTFTWIILKAPGSAALAVSAATSRCMPGNGNYSKGGRGVMVVSPRG